MTGPPARAMAITRTLAPVEAAAAASCERSPTTGMPRIRSRRFAGSSSSIATGRYPALCWPISCCTSWVPALPAPKTMIFSAEEAGVLDRCRTANAAYRVPSIASSAMAAAAAAVSSGACWPGIRTSPAATTHEAVRPAAMLTPATSSRLPRWYRPRYSPAARPHPAEDRLTAMARQANRVTQAPAPGRSPVVLAAASNAASHTAAS